MNVTLDEFQIKTAHGVFMTVTGIINEEQLFGVFVNFGQVDVIHLASCSRISTANGFQTLAGAFSFIDMIYPIKNWADSVIQFSVSERDQMIAAYEEALSKE
jgi:hypothetical protein